MLFANCASHPLDQPSIRSNGQPTNLNKSRDEQHRTGTTTVTTIANRCPRTNNARLHPPRLPLAPHRHPHPHNPPQPRRRRRRMDLLASNVTHAARLRAHAVPDRHGRTAEPAIRRTIRSERHQCRGHQPTVRVRGRSSRGMRVVEGCRGDSGHGGRGRGMGGFGGVEGWVG